MERLLDILSYARCHGSKGEMEVIEKYILPLSPIIIKNDKNEHMAYIITIGDSSILWSAHTDTVHSISDNVRQVLVIEHEVVSTEGHTILGADDGAGMWMLLEMIDAGVEGTYIFHRGEECGGIGSSYLAKHHSDMLSEHSHAIAFDRKGEGSIITHQCMDQSCSKGFAKEFGDAIYELSSYEVNLGIDEGGIFTDTANYIGIIPECTNISVGYYDAHTTSESLNLTYLMHLRNAMIKVKSFEFGVYEKEKQKEWLVWDEDVYHESSELLDLFSGLDVEGIKELLIEDTDFVAESIKRWVEWGRPF